jgi:hypothetical protein
VIKEVFELLVNGDGNPFVIVYRRDVEQAIPGSGYLYRTDEGESRFAPLGRSFTTRERAVEEAALLLAIEKRKVLDKYETALERVCHVP